MIRVQQFLDPRGQPRDGLMPIIGGPLDGDQWSAGQIAPFSPHGWYSPMTVVTEGRGVPAVYEWAFVWIPEVDDDDEPAEAWQR